MSAAKDPMEALAEASKRASRKLSIASTDQKNRALAEMALSVRRSSDAICAANAKDVAAARKDGKNAAFLDRLQLTPARVEAMSLAVEEIAVLPDPVGEVVETWMRPNGLRVEKVRLPLGVVLMIFESRPNVTSDAAALCLKSGNAVILRGGSESLRSNRAIADALQAGIAKADLPPEVVSLVPTAERDAMLRLLKLEHLINLCIPRGGEGLIHFVADNARVPVVKHYKGVCHVYVHRDADLRTAENIVVNAKTQRPGVCNAAECLLVDREVAETFLAHVGKRLADAGVELRGCPTSVTLLKRAGIPVKQAVAEDFGREFLDLIMAVKVVKDLDAAMDHIARYGSEHTEAIITRDTAAAERFSREVEASAVMVNASTRFNDGGELGLGAEIGISTSRLHAFGPMGLRELTAQKYVVTGDGQVR